MGAPYPSPRRWTKAEDYVHLPAWLQERSRRGSQKYFFHLREGGHFLRDDEGLSLSDLEEAKLEAVRGAKAILAAHRALGTTCLDSVIEVETEEGERLFDLLLRQVQDLDALTLQFATIGARSR